VVRRTAIVSLGVALTALAGCSRGVTGTYECVGMPDIQSLTLEAGGRYTSKGEIMGHVTSGSGTYKVDAGHVTLEGSYSVEGLTQAEPNKVIFDRLNKGQLKSLLTTCKK
jgi:hypothetical protein